MLRDQKQLLIDTDWDVLIVLDACRVDSFREHCGKCEVVRSRGARTREWARRTAEVLNDKHAIIFNGNPVLSGENHKRGLGMHIVPVWKGHWGFFSERKVPACHPMSVNAIILEWITRKRLNKHKIVVWYLQPHTPYIGDPPLPMERRASCWTNMAKKAGVRLIRPGKGVRTGETSWDEIRRAYAGNLKVGWDAARHLIQKLSGRIIVTSDHSELLGEGDCFGHEPGWGPKYPQLYEVPWAEFEGGQMIELERAKSDAEIMHERLKAIGYE